MLRVLPTRRWNRVQASTGYVPDPALHSNCTSNAIQHTYCSADAKRNTIVCVDANPPANFARDAKRFNTPRCAAKRSGAVSCVKVAA